MKHLTSARICVAGLAILVTGCYERLIDSRPVPAARYPEYGFGIYNATPLALSGVRINWVTGGQHLGDRGAGNFLASGASKTDHFEPDPIPEHVTVAWITPDGFHHQHEAVIASIIPDIKHFSGTVWIKFADWSDTGFTVVPVTEEEQRRIAVGGHYPLP